MSSGKGKAETNRKTVPDLMGMELRNKTVFNLFSAEHILMKNSKTSKSVTLHSVP